MKSHRNRLDNKRQTTSKRTRTSAVFSHGFLATLEQLELRTLLTVDALGASALHSVQDELSARAFMSSNCSHVNVQATQAAAPAAASATTSVDAQANTTTSQVTTTDTASALVTDPTASTDNASSDDFVRLLDGYLARYRHPSAIQPPRRSCMPRPSLRLR